MINRVLYFLAGLLMPVVIVSAGLAIGGWKPPGADEVIRQDADVQAQSSDWVEKILALFESPVERLKEAAEAGDPEAQFSLGDAYRVGSSVPRDFAEAARWYRSAAQQGHATARYNLGIMYGKGFGVPKDDGVAVRWIRMAAEQGFAKAQSALGAMYVKGWGVAQDNMEAVRWFRMAAEQGDADAQYKLGEIYRAGRGVAQDDSEASRWFRMSSEQGHGEAQSVLAFMERHGQAEDGNVEAQFMLGVNYDQGEAFEPDYSVAIGEAVKWLRRAAEQGDVRAQLYLGTIYAEGRPNLPAHVEMSRARLEQIPTFEGPFVFNGRVVEAQVIEPDNGEAQKWWTLAAEQGDEAAANNLRLLKQAIYDAIPAPNAPYATEVITNPGNMAYKLWHDGGLWRQEFLHDETVVIVRPDRGVIYHYDTRDSTGEILRYDPVLFSFLSDMPDLKPKRGGEETINGVTTTRYSFSGLDLVGDPLSGTAWITEAGVEMRVELRLEGLSGSREVRSLEMGPVDAALFEPPNDVAFVDRR